MNPLQAAVIKLMGDEIATTGELTERLNRNGWGVKHDDVLDALHRLEIQRLVERLWRRKQQDAKADFPAKKAATTGQ